MGRDQAVDDDPDGTRGAGTGADGPPEGKSPNGEPHATGADGNGDPQTESPADGAA